MCTVLLAYRSHPNYRLILAENRDVYYDRPTLPAAFWDDAPQLLAGKDLVAGGTWLGITKRGRLSLLSNVREPKLRKRGAPSRGFLVSNFLLSQESPYNYLQKIAPTASQYNGFNLIVGNLDDLYYYSNRAGQPQSLLPGLYGLSNDLLDTPWPKVQRGKQALAELLQDVTLLSTEALFDILSDRAQAFDQCLPDTGIGIETERKLSSIFITSFPRKPNEPYGTTSSTVLLIDKDENVIFAERTFTPNSTGWEEVNYQFKIQADDTIS
jgi:uncharacterized protein with NRDE domain